MDDQVGSGRYSSVSEYVRELIRDDEKRKAQEKLEALPTEGIQSGSPTEMAGRIGTIFAAKQLSSSKSANPGKRPDDPRPKRQTAKRDLIAQWVYAENASIEVADRFLSHQAGTSGYAAIPRFGRL